MFTIWIRIADSETSNWRLSTFNPDEQSFNTAQEAVEKLSFQCEHMSWAYEYQIRDEKTGTVVCRMFGKKMPSRVKDYF